MKEDPTINYAFALKHYNQNGRGGNRESEKKDYVDVESQKAWDAERAVRAHFSALPKPTA